MLWRQWEHGAGLVGVPVVGLRALRRRGSSTKETRLPHLAFGPPLHATVAALRPDMHTESQAETDTQGVNRGVVTKPRRSSYAAPLPHG